MASLNDPTLHRFWFVIPGAIGIGVTAYSRQEAEHLAQNTALQMGRTFQPTSVIEDIDIQDLDQNHVIPNMGPPNLYGVWFPCLNI